MITVNDSFVIRYIISLSIECVWVLITALFFLIKRQLISIHAKMNVALVRRVSCRKVAVYKRAQLSVLIDWSVGYYRARSYLS